MRIVQFNQHGIVVHCVSPEDYGHDDASGLMRLWDCAAAGADAAEAELPAHSYLLLADDDPRNPQPGDRMAADGTFATCPVWAARRDAELAEAATEIARQAAREAKLAALLDEDA